MLNLYALELIKISETKPLTPNFFSFLKQVNHYLTAVEV